MQDSPALISTVLNDELSGRALDTEPCFSERSESRLEAIPVQGSLHSTDSTNVEPTKIAVAADKNRLPPPLHYSTEPTKGLDGINAEEVTSSLSCEAATSVMRLSNQSLPSAEAAQLSEDSGKTPDVHLADREPLAKPLLSADFTVSFLRVSMLILHCLHAHSLEKTSACRPLQQKKAIRQCNISCGV